MDKRYNNYTLAILSALISGTILGIILLLLQQIALGTMPEWLFELLFLPLFTSQLMAGVGYTQRLMDILLKEHTLFELFKLSLRKLVTLDTYKKLGQRLLGKNLGEFTGLCLGITAGIVVTVLQATLGVTLPITILKPGFGLIVICFLNIGRLAGLFGRCGKVFDYSRNNVNNWKVDWPTVKSLVTKENVNYTLSIVGGLVGGLVFAGIVIGVFGTSAFTFGSGPAILACLIFGLNAVSASTSASSYIGRCVDIVVGNRSILYPFASAAPTPAPDAISRRYEKMFTLIGVALGLTIAIGLVAGGITTLPFFGSGLPPLISGILLFGFCISAGGGLGNRVGHTIDRWLKKPLVPAPDITEKEEEPEQTLEAPEPSESSTRQKIFSLLHRVTSCSSKKKSDDDPDSKPPPKPIGRKSFQTQNAHGFFYVSPSPPANLTPELPLSSSPRCD